MTLPIRVEALAVQEAEGAMQWYERRRTGFGADFFAELERAMMQIARAPLASPVSRADARARQLALRRFPFAIVYLARDDEVVVIAIAHLRRRPGYWRERA